MNAHIMQPKADDGCRTEILRILHNHLQNARGMRKTGMLLRPLQAALRPSGFKMQVVVRNLTYLVEKGWVTELKDERTIRTKTGMRVEAERRTYRISDAGMDNIEGESAYRQNPSRASGITISNVSGMVLVGDGNVAHQHFATLAGQVDSLSKAIEASLAVTDEDKVAAVADLTSIRGQLMRASPHKSIVQQLWAGVERIASLADCTALSQLVGAGLNAAGLT